MVLSLYLSRESSDFISIQFGAHFASHFLSALIPSAARIRQIFPAYGFDVIYGSEK